MSLKSLYEKDTRKKGYSRCKICMDRVSSKRINDHIRNNHPREILTLEYQQDQRERTPAQQEKNQALVQVANYEDNNQAQAQVNHTHQLQIYQTEQPYKGTRMEDLAELTDDSSEETSEDEESMEESLHIPTHTTDSSIENTSVDINTHFPLDNNEIDFLVIPEEVSDRKQRNRFPSHLYGRKTVTDNEKCLFKYYSDHCRDIGNPFTLNRRSNRSVIQVTISTMIKLWTQMVQLLNFPITFSLKQIFWELVRPNSVKKIVSLAHANKMAKNTMRHFIEYAYRLAWLLNHKKFLIFIEIPQVESDVEGKIALLGAFYNATLPKALADGKQSVRDHRSLSNMKAAHKWCETSEMLNIVSLLQEKITDETPSMSVRDAAIFAFYTTNPHPRAQNMRLLVIEDDHYNHTDAELKVLVEKKNELFSSKRRSSECYSGVIFKCRLANGSFRIKWTNYKTFPAYGIQSRMISHPVTVSLFARWFALRSQSNSCLWQDGSGNPYYDISKSFIKITKLYLNKNISIGDWRIITNTKVKNESTHQDYLTFVALCLHSETVSNKF